MDATSDTLTEAAIAALRRALGEEALETDTVLGAPLCVLVDPVIHDPLAEHEDTRALPRLPLAMDTHAPEHRPYLLVLHDSHAQERALNATVRIAVEECMGLHDGEAGQPRSVCAWITADGLGQPQAQRNLAYALGHRATLSPPAPYPRERTVFRYWDPRIALHLPGHLVDTWALALHAMHVQGWWSLQPDGTLASLGPVLPPGTDDTGPVLSTFALDARQWQALLVIGWCHRVAQLLPAWELQQAPEPRAVEDAVRRALAHGLHEEADILSFAHCALTLHPLFDRHGEVARGIAALPAAGPHRSGFAELPAQWDDELTRVLHAGQWLSDTAAPKQQTT